MNKLIIVDDSATMRQQVRQALTPAGIEIVEAVDGLDALEKIEGDDSISLMILDVNMPRLGGIDLVERLSAAGKIEEGLQVVMLTTEGDAGLIKRAKNAGAKGWIVKPFKPELLLSAVERMAA